MNLVILISESNGENQIKSLPSMEIYRMGKFILMIYLQVYGVILNLGNLELFGRCAIMKFCRNGLHSMIGIQLNLVMLIIFSLLSIRSRLTIFMTRRMS
jgi:hypothetical protein